MNTDLTTALAARDTARAQHAADAEALARGRERLAATEADIGRLAAEDAAAVERHARRLEQQTREGKAGAVPQLVPTDKHVAEQIAAARTRAAAVQMVANLEAAEQGSRQVLADAKQRVTEARNALKRAECDRFAERIAQLRAEELELCFRLAVLDLDSRHCLTDRGHAALAFPPGRPTAATLLNGKLLADVNSSPLANRQAIEAARAYWLNFDNLPPPQPTTAADERAA